MLRNRRERGEGQFGCLVGLVLLLIAGLVAYRMIPVKVKTAEMRETVVNEARSAGQNSDQAVMKAILYKAEQLQLPITEKDVQIKRANSMIRVEVNYTVPVQFPGYTYNWNFNHKAENPLF
jgi:hypothetical protein